MGGGGGDGARALCIYARFQQVTESLTPTCSTVHASAFTAWTQHECKSEPRQPNLLYNKAGAPSSTCTHRNLHNYVYI